MPYLPAGPLVDKLRLAVEPTCLHDATNHRAESRGLDGVAYEFARISGWSVESARREIRHVLNGTRSMLRDRTADAFACALGCHPARIWLDWYEVTDRGVCA